MDTGLDVPGISDMVWKPLIPGPLIKTENTSLYEPHTYSLYSSEAN